jgi:hypothetical protein
VRGAQFPLPSFSDFEEKMETKLFELRDRNTFVPVVAILLRSDDSQERWLLRRCGYSNQPMARRFIMLTRLEGRGIAHVDEHYWGDRTFQSAHGWIERHWDRLETGDVVDVEHILGETTAPKKSERYGG